MQDQARTAILQQQGIQLLLSFLKVVSGDDNAQRYAAKILANLSFISRMYCINLSVIFIYHHDCEARKIITYKHAIRFFSVNQA